MSRPTPRRPASFRGTTPRPRKLAGQSVTARTEPAPLEPVVDETVADETGEQIDVPPREPVRLRKEAPAAAGGTDAPDDVDDIDDEGDRDTGPFFLASAKTTRTMILALAMLALVLAAQGVWWIRHLSEEGPDRAVDEAGAAVAVPAGRPVVASEVAVLEGVEAAAKAAQEIVAVDHKKYDAEVDKAAELMTADFEEQYRRTAGDFKEQVVAQQMVVQVNVVAQGVVRANRTELEALVFLNQVVSRVRNKEPETVVTPFKVWVKMVHTDQGWLIDDLETDAPQRDKNN